MITDFQLPKYTEIPDVGLFLEQVAKYINGCLSPLGEPELTGSMISNYVKKGIIDNPVKKQYGREQIAYLIYIAITKNVLSLDDINVIFDMQKAECEAERAYNYFCIEFPSVLNEIYKGGIVSGQKEMGNSSLESIRALSRNVSITAANKIFLDMSFKEMKNTAE